MPNAGPKALALGRMLQFGLPVPQGFVVTARAFRRYVESVPEWRAILDTLDAATGNVLSDAQQLSQRIHDGLGNLPMPLEVVEAVLSSLDSLPAIQLWAVRSSATAEDLPQASFAGQHDSFLNVPRAEILDRVRRCWLSLFTPRAIQYRASKGIPHRNAAMAVIVQEMVPAEIAGVLFTAEPTTGDPWRIVIEAAPGLGDQVVTGRVTPERFVLAKATYAVLEHATSGRSSCPSGGDRQPRGGGAAAEESVAPTGLDEVTAKRLVTLSRQVEQILRGPLDIEWAGCNGQLHLLQARPITGKMPIRSWEERQVWSNLNCGEVMPDVTTPMTWTMIQPFLHSLVWRVFRLVGADMRRAAPIGLVAGRIYFNANTGWAAIKPFAFLLHHVPNVAEALGGGQIEDYRQAPVIIPPEDLPDLGFRWPKYILSWPSVLLDLLRHSPRRGDAWTADLKVRVSELERVDVEGMSAKSAATFFSQLMREGFEGWDLLYLGTQGAVLPLFQKACRDWLDDPNLTLGYQLFSGLGGMPEAEAGLALWRLALLAHADQQTETALGSEGDWNQVSARLNSTESGQRFLAAWAEFMREHGHHCRGELELFNLRWSERPDYILGLVRNYLGSVGRSDPLENQQQLTQKRLELTDQCRRRLTNPLKRWIFSRALRRAQRLAVNREEWKNQAVRRIVVMRRVLLTLGRRLCEQGILNEPDDVFFLEVSEVEPVVNGTAQFKVKEILCARRREYEDNIKLHPPPVVFGKYKPTDRTVLPKDGNEKELQGIPVSPGVARGRAKVILRSDDHEQVLPGEILIAPFTDPAWTPYFVTAAAVVMDQGGLLSHGSIVAREYGLPAVTNVGSATRLIRTGDLVEVDGDRGHVGILERVG